MVTRRQELLGLITQEQHRAEHYYDAFVARQARRLRRHLTQLEAELTALEQTDARLTGQIQRLTAIPGVVQSTAWLLLVA